MSKSVKRVEDIEFFKCQTQDQEKITGPVLYQTQGQKKKKKKKMLDFIVRRLWLIGI